MQDPNSDGNEATSDGILLSGGGLLPQRPAIGDFIEIEATVEEEQHGKALPRTRLVSPSRLAVLREGNPLPEPIALTELPDQSIAEGIAFWEPLEGTRVVVKKGVVVAPTTRFGELVLLTQENALPGSGYAPESMQIFTRLLDDGDVDYNPERVLVDDETLEEPIVTAPGDEVHDLTGVVDYGFGSYKIQPETVPSVDRRTTRDLVRRDRAQEGERVITTFNLNNLFDRDDDPNKNDETSTPTREELETKLEKLALAVRSVMELPDILVAQELENEKILQTLGDRINRAEGTRYRAISFDASDGRSIEVGFLWDAGRVSLQEAFLLSESHVPGVEEAFGSRSPSPGREPLVGLFIIDGRRLTIIGNHFKSKLGDDPLFGVSWPPERSTETQRKAQARVVRQFADSLFEDDPSALVMIAGDMNDFPFAEPGEGPDHPLAILEGESSPIDRVEFANLIRHVSPPERFTFIFQGNSQVLDYLLVSPGLLELWTGVDILHFNAGFPEALARDHTTPKRASDHDPVEARFNVAPN
jgi:predicted extracellular nuclease